MLLKGLGRNFILRRLDLYYNFKLDISPGEFKYQIYWALIIIITIIIIIIKLAGVGRKKEFWFFE